VALAPLWGFCEAADPGWNASMAFAFSPANPGWAGGGLPGLGSAHTPGSWTLGDVQAWTRARVIGDLSGQERTIRRLELVAFADGMLPEAYETDGIERIRTWFAWPGAALAARLSVRPVG
jgi:meiotically up-regulated gene 157 (Mug157) protein